MLNKPTLKLIEVLEVDIADFEHIPPTVQHGIAVWIEQDRKTPNRQRPDKAWTSYWRAKPKAKAGKET